MGNGEVLFCQSSAEATNMIYEKFPSYLSYIYKYNVYINFYKQTDVKKIPDKNFRISNIDLSIIH